MKFTFTGFAIRRPVAVIVVAMCFVGLGVIAWYKIPLMFLPEVSSPFINCQIIYPGASPAQVEQEVAIPAEGEFRTIGGIDKIRTISDSNGCFVNMNFNLNTDMTAATAEVRDRMERLKLVLPKEVDRMLLQRFSSRSIPIIAAGFFRAGDDEEFVHLVRTIAEPRLRRIEGVADVVIETTRSEREVLIEFKQDVLRSLNISLYQLVEVLRQSSINTSVGDLLNGETKFYVRAVGEYRRPEDIANLVISPNGLRVKDVADVRYTTRDEKSNVSIDGKGGAFILIIKESEANTVATCNAVNAELEKLKNDPTFAGSDLFTFFDQSSLIMSALHNLVDSGKYGAAMSLLILFVFMYRVRPTLIVAFCIPGSVVAALVAMFFLGMTLNLVSMVSLIIAIGMLVDHAIVVMENIIRYRQLGLPPLESARRGALEVGMAITSGTFTTLVVFVPMFYMQTGRMSVFTRELAIPMMVSLSASLLIAVTVVPLLMVYVGDRPQQMVFGWMERSRAGASSGISRVLSLPFRAIFSVNVIAKIIAVYSWFLERIMRHRLMTFCLIAALLGITWWIPYQSVGMQDIPTLDTRQVQIKIKLDQNFDLASAAEVFHTLEKEIDNYRAQYGVKNVFSRYEATGGEINVYLYTKEDDPKWDDPPYSTKDVLDVLAASLPARMPGVDLQYQMADAGANGAEREVALQVMGDDTKLLAEYGEQIKKRMEAMPNLTNVTTDTERTRQEVQLRIDSPLAQRAGISPIMIAQTVDVALRGTRLPYMKQGGREVPVWAQFREEDRKSRANLDNVAVPGMTGSLVPLSQLVTYTKANSPTAIQRLNGKNVVTISAKTRVEELTGIQQDLLDISRDFDLPPGYSIALGEQLGELNLNFLNFTSSLIMAIILVYLVMAATFESYVLPLSILTTVPMAFVGVYWMLYTTHTSIDMLTLIGCLLMVGVIVQNGIVMVDHTNLLRRHLPRYEAIIQSGRDRFRPVIMTALTTILGCVPLAIATSGGAVAFVGLGRAFIGGITIGTILTLVVVPLFYSLIDDFQEWLSAFFGHMLHMKPKIMKAEYISAPDAPLP